MLAWFKLIRWKNLLMVGLAQGLAWVCLIKWFVDIPLPDYHLWFALLLLSTLLITAAGYAINDYFDLRIDAINKPEKVLLIQKLNFRMVILVHISLNVLAWALAVYVSWQLHTWSLSLIQLVTIVLLWFYSTTFKRQMIIGNVVVALLTALAAILPLIYFQSLIRTDDDCFKMWSIGAVYFAFAFLLNWMREIVKDMEDFKGDEEDGCRTMPIVLGLKKSTTIVKILGGLTIGILVLLVLVLWLKQYIFLGCWTLLIVTVPIGIWTVQFGQLATTAHYAQYSKLLKFIMLLGLVTLPLAVMSINHVI